MRNKMLIVDKLRLNLEFGKYVELDYEILDKVCELIGKDTSKSCKPYSWDNSLYWLENTKGLDEVSQYFTIGNAINFKYWQVDKSGRITQCLGVKGGIKVKGAMYMWRSLRMCYDEETFPILDAHKLARISMKDLKKIFKADNGNVPLPLLEERLKNWQDLGSKLCEYWDGEFYNLLKEAKNSLYTFIQYSRQFRAFDDPLCKMTMANAIFHQGRGITRFRETIFPAIDYHLVKQQLRIGILIPKVTVKNKLIHEKLVSKKEGRELRNACLKAFIYIMKKTHVKGDIIDNKWWFNRKKCKDENPICRNSKAINICPFARVCKKNIQYKGPLENTRYY
jgi:hypothetical protein